MNLPHRQSDIQHISVLACRTDLCRPKLSSLKPHTVLMRLLLLHSFRHIGLMFLARAYVALQRHSGVTTLPEELEPPGNIFSLEKISFSWTH